MGQTTSELRQEVDGKRDDAAQKIDQIEQRVSDTVGRVQEGVTGTTEQVKATVQESIQGVQDAVGQTAQQVGDQVKATTQQVTEQVKATVDWRRQVEERPLVMLGAAFLGGFVLGNLTGGEDDGDRGQRRSASAAPSSAYGASYGAPLYGSQGGHGHGAGGFQGSPPQPTSYGVRDQEASGWGRQAQQSGGAGMMSGLRGMLEQSGVQDTLTNAASALVGSVGERLRSTLEEQIPGFADQMRQRTEKGGQQGQSGGTSGAGQSSWASASGQSSRDFGAGGSGKSVDPPTQEAATTDAAGRTAPYFGGAESGQGASATST